MSNTERRLMVKIPRKDMTPLSDNQYQLQVAKSVISNGKLVFNTVWKSTVLAPNIAVTWKPVYGFNWTSDVPGDGVSVTLGGDWMQCNIGQALDIDDNGYFMPSSATPDKTSMMIGTNNYKAQNSEGIRIVIGVMGHASRFEPVFVDPVSLGYKMSATFQPQEKLQWWYDSGSKQATMFTDHKTPYEQGDFSAPDPVTGTFTKQSTYSYADGAWTTTSTA